MLIFMVVIVFVILLLVIVFLAVILLKRLLVNTSGWNELVKKYQTSISPASEKIFTKQNLQIGLVQYRYCASIAVLENGLFISLNQSSILVPFSDIKNVQESTLYWQKVYNLDLGEKLPQVTVFENIYELIKKYR